MSKYADIIERLEKAKGSNYQLERDIDAFAHFGGPGSLDRTPPNYTASIDAAIALVERILPGAKTGLYINNMTSHPKEEGARAFVKRDKGPKCPHTGIRWPKINGDCYYAVTAPLAILLALFRALEAKETLT